GEVRVGDQHHRGAGVGDLDQLAHQAGPVDHRHALLEAGVGALVDLDGVGEVRAGAGDHARGGGGDVTHPLDVELVEQSGQLLGGVLVADLGAPQLLELCSQPLVLGFEVAEVGDSVPGVGEGLGGRLGYAAQGREGRAGDATGALDDA